MAGLAFVDGAFCALENAKISIFDWGFLRSDACQDTISVWKGRFFCLDQHLDRFARSCRELRLAPPYGRDEIAAILKQGVRRAGLADAYVQMIATRGRPAPGSRDPRSCTNTFLAFFVPYVHIAPDQGRGVLDLAVSTRARIPASSVPSTIKNYHWIDFELALLDAYEQGATTVALVDAEGNLTEGPGFNLFMVKDGRLATPAANVLPGITRGVVVELAAELGLPVELRAIAPAELYAADEIFATSTAGGIMTVASVDRQPVGAAGSNRPVTERLRALYWKRREEGWRGTPVDAEDTPIEGTKIDA